MKAGDEIVRPTSNPILGWQALKWNYLGNITRILSQFIIGILLARLLGPEPFGVIAIAWMMLGIGNLFADLGFGAGLVQRERLSTFDLRFIFTCQMAFAALLSISGVIAAPYIAAYFHKPEAAPVIQAMSLLFVFQCLGETAAAVLRRALNFKVLQQVAIMSYLTGYLLVGLPLAWVGMGVWSLVAAHLVQSLLNSSLLIWITSVPLAPCVRRGAHDMVRFGLKVPWNPVVMMFIGVVNRLSARLYKPRFRTPNARPMKTASRLLMLQLLRFGVTGATVGEYARTFRVPVLVSTVVAAMAAGADSAVSFLPALPRLAVVAAVAGLTLAVLVPLLGARFLTQNLGTLVVVDKLSGPVRRFLDV